MKKMLFAIKDYEYLADKVLACGDLEKGELEVTHFTDGERYQRIKSNIENKDIVLIGGTVTDKATLELYDLASSLVSYGANSLTLVVPYFGYSTMERSVLPGEIVTAKNRARLLSSIPRSNAAIRCYCSICTPKASSIILNTIFTRYIFTARIL
jgi:ribose-phosphate pyrophosphokinase